MSKSNQVNNSASVKWTAQGLFTVAFLGITAGVQMSDMGLQAISLSAIQETFGVSDTTLGALQGLAGVLIGSALAVPLARFADRFSRKRVLLCLILTSTVMMVLSALAPNFPLFFIGRSAAGITEFAMVPLVYSMIPDLAPERHRVLANLSFAAFMTVGASSGFYFADTLLTASADLIPLAIESWRSAFLLLSCAGLPLLLFATLTADPRRRLDAEALQSGSSLPLFLHRHWKTIAFFACTAGFLALAVQAFNQLIALALERRFDADPGQIGHAMGIIVLTTTMGCLPVAWWLDRSLARHLGRAARPLVMGVCGLISIFVVLLLTAMGTLDRALIIVGLTLFMTNTANALVPTILQDLIPASLRARGFAIWSLVVSIFGAAGPLLAGTLSGFVFDGGLTDAIVWIAIPALMISAYCAMQSFLLIRNEQAMAPG